MSLIIEVIIIKIIIGGGRKIGESQATISSIFIFIDAILGFRPRSRSRSPACEGE